MATIQLRRGLLSGLPTGADGEPLFTVDQKRLYIGYTGTNALLGVLLKIDATAAPTVNDDAGDGYSVGSTWIDITNDRAYQCIDSTVGAAVWREYQSRDGDLDALAALTGTNTIYYRSAANTWTAVTIGSGVTFAGGTLSASGSGGTVTSVNLTAPAAGITVSGGPITNSGSITLALADDLAALEALTGTNTIYYRSAANTWTAVTIGTGLDFTAGTLSNTVGGLADGNKGDITVSASGATWTVNSNAIAFAKMQDIASQRLIGRDTAAPGDPEEVEISTALDWLDVGVTEGDLIVRDTTNWTVLPAHATSGLVLTSNGAGVAPTYQKTGNTLVCHMREVQAANTAGGTFTSGAWQTRTLNVKPTDTIGVSLGSNLFTLPAGTYRIYVRCPGVGCDHHKARLWNSTDGGAVLEGSSCFASSTSAVGATDSIIQGRFTIASGKTFAIHHRCATTKATNGFGVATNFTGADEVFTEVWIEKEF